MRWAEALLAAGLGDHLAIEAGVEVDATGRGALAWAPGGAGCREEWVWGGAGGTTLLSWAV